VTKVMQNPLPRSLSATSKLLRES